MDLARASLLSSYLCSHSRQTNQTCICMRALLHHWCKCTYLCISISCMFKVRTMKTESWKNGPALQHDPFQQRCSRRRRRRGRKAQHWPRSWPKVPLHGRLSNLSQCLCIVAHLRCLPPIW